MPSTAVKLSCEQCRNRKTKCDKGNPCTACKHAGISCTAVQRARLPRGRAVKSQKKNAKLENRLEQLEDLIKQLETQVKPGVTEKKSPNSSDSARSPSDKLDSFVARDFWVELSQEVAGLRNTLEESSDDGEADADASTQESPLPFWGNPSHALLTGQSLLSANLDFLEPPPDRLRAILLDLYRQRVDCLFKVLHWPSTMQAIEGCYAGVLPESPSTRALEFAIYFLAVCSMGDDECRKRLGAAQEPLIQQYRLGAEVYISRAKLLYSPDLMVLQAFVIYILGLRVCRESALSWTLVATAVRIATALRLPATEPEGRSTLELEVCRRIWFCIGVLDSQTAFDRGFPPITPLQDFASQPKILNDSQLSELSVERMSSDPFTDMSFMYLLQEATICLRKLIVPPKLTGADEDPWSEWKSRVRTIAAFEESMKQHRNHLKSSTLPIARFTEFATEHISLNMHLLLRRPPYRHKHSPVPPWDDFDLLEATTSAMERVMRKGNDPVFVPFLWFSRSWVEWNALAVLLAELCTPRQDALAARAYDVACLVYEQYSEQMSGSDAQMLWKPIAKLMRRVRQVRGIQRPSDQPSSVQRSSITPLPANTLPTEQYPVIPSQSSAAIDTQLADLALYQPPTTGEVPGQPNMPIAPWFNEIGDLQPNNASSIGTGGDMSWFNWDNFLGDIYSGVGPNMGSFNPDLMSQ